MTKIVFMGTPAFSVPILESLIEAMTFKRLSRNQIDQLAEKSDYPNACQKATLKHNLLVLQPEKISGSPEMEKVIDLAPDLIVTATFGQFYQRKF